MIAQRRQAVYVWINLGALIVNLVGNMLLIPRFGAQASAWLTVVTESGVLCVSLIAIWSALHFVPGFGLLRTTPLEAQA
jgi:O-antigen/teichoic acid export membrane protein